LNPGTSGGTVNGNIGLVVVSVITQGADRVLVDTVGLDLGREGVQASELSS